MFEIIEKQHTPKVPYIKDCEVWIKKYKTFLKEYLQYAQTHTQAVGLASTQVSYKGKRINSRFLAIKLNDTWILAINPKVRKYIGDSTSKIEGCLTWGSEKIIVAQRYSSIVIDYYTVDGKYQKETIDDAWQAQIWQHEINHLDGVKETVLDKSPAPYRTGNKIGRNDLCPCGSGLKYKKCHLGLDISDFLV